MSYIRPLPSSADATWVGVQTYTRPPSSAAGASWLAGLFASGFSSTRVGVASTPLPAQGLLASRYGTPSLAMRGQGFCSTQYGTPETLGYYQAASLGVVAAPGIPQREMVASGLLSAQIGIASTPSPAFGFLATQSGTPRGWQHWQHRSLPPTTVIPGAFSPVNHVGQAGALQAARFGHHTGFVVVTQPIGWATKAQGALATRYGVHSTAVPSIGRAGGFLATRYGLPGSTSAMFGFITRYGVPTSRTRHGAAGLLGTVVPAATSRVAGHAQGVRLPDFGMPVGETAHKAAPLLAARYGTHATVRSNTFRAYGFGPVARLPVPRGWQRFNHQALGDRHTAVGAPTCAQRHRVLHIAPISRAGTPTLMRAAQC